MEYDNSRITVTANGCRFINSMDQVLATNRYTWTPSMEKVRMERNGKFSAWITSENYKIIIPKMGGLISK